MMPPRFHVDTRCAQPMRPTKDQPMIGPQAQVGEVPV
jgi:hypothetical protein